MVVRYWTGILKRKKKVLCARERCWYTISPQLVNICNDYDAPPFSSCGQDPPGGPRITVWPFNLSSLWWCTNRERETDGACHLFHLPSFSTANFWGGGVGGNGADVRFLIAHSLGGKQWREWSSSRNSLSNTHNISLTIQKKKKKRNREKKFFVIDRWLSK